MDDGGEGIKIPPVIENTKTETVSKGDYASPTNSEQATPAKDKKFWGLSKWVWFVAGAIVIFAVLTIAIVLAVR
jgi:hypothetical protein